MSNLKECLIEFRRLLKEWRDEIAARREQQLISITTSENPSTTPLSIEPPRTTSSPQPCQPEILIASSHNPVYTLTTISEPLNQIPNRKPNTQNSTQKSLDRLCTQKPIRTTKNPIINSSSENPSYRTIFTKITITTNSVLPTPISTGKSTRKTTVQRPKPKRPQSLRQPT
jgi:hypothetical protein